MPQAKTAFGQSSGAATGPTRLQKWCVGIGVLALLASLLLWRDRTIAVADTLIVCGFALSACSKLLLALVGRAQAPVRLLPATALPTYTLLVPLYKEAEIVSQLISAILRIDYPKAKLQAILILEADDNETLDALAWLRLPSFVEVLVRPAGGPQTKPNALNAALPFATGEFLVVYDAEDIPHPQQLQEAASRFSADPAMACLQAPLRISNPDGGFLARQFALEYAAQFEALIPGLVRLGFAFPLGGTSNHLRTAILRELGGWDPYNVTEDADLGLRLGVGGHKVGVMALPTEEDAPTDLRTWLPQRSRWVKGYMQTWGVRMRRPWDGGAKNALLLHATLGMSILGAALHGPLVALLGCVLVGDLVADWAPASRLTDLSILAGGWGASVLAAALGAQRAGLKMDLMDALACLLYWPMLSAAFVFAAWQLVAAPHYWSKTPHVPNASPASSGLDAPAPWGVSPAM